jgi:septum formation protein
VVIGVDTLVAVDEDVVGKPLDRFDAVGILTRLSGTRHRVISGMCLWPVLAPTPAGVIPAGEPRLLAEASWVKMRPMSAAEIDAYVASGEADDKAGAYAVQETGDRFVEKIDGSFLNVVGLPLELFQRELPARAREWFGAGAIPE